MERIQIIGVNELDNDEREMVEKLAGEYYGKIERIIKKVEYVSVHVKKRDKTGERKRYELKVKVVAPLPKIESAANEWDIATALHVAFKEILRILEHRLHV